MMRDKKILKSKTDEESKIEQRIVLFKSHKAIYIFASYKSLRETQDFVCEMSSIIVVTCAKHFDGWVVFILCREFQGIGHTLQGIVERLLLCIIYYLMRMICSVI